MLVEYTFNVIGFRFGNEDDICDAIISENAHSECYVSPAINGWVSVIDRDCDPRVPGAEESAIRLAGSVCRRCKCPAMSVSLIASSAIAYWVFDVTGNIVDYSRPNSDEPSFEEARGLRGDLGSLAGLVPERHISRELLYAVLSETNEDIELLPSWLGGILGNQYLGFRSHADYFEELRASGYDILEAKRFLHVDEAGKITCVGETQF